MRQRALAVSAVLGSAIVGMLALAPGAAHAANTTTCQAWGGDVCTTGAVGANRSSHSVLMTVRKIGDTDAAICVVYDNDNYIEVGRIKTSGTASKRITGLYGTYFMGCFTNNGKGAVEGLLSNA